MHKRIWNLVLLFTLSTIHPVSAHPARPSFDVIIDVGHGGVDGGAVEANVYEKHINLAVAKLLYDEMDKAGYQVILNRADDHALSEDNRWLRTNSRHIKDLAQRKHLAIELAPKVMISLHANVASNSSARGPNVLYQRNNQSLMLADIIQHSLNRLYGIKHREPVKGRPYYLLNQSVCPTVIVEMGYLTNPGDRQALITPEHQVKLAKSIRDAVDEYFLLVGGLGQEPQEPSFWATLLHRLLEWVAVSD
ncbi:N-acetylmuramoyl-L-alanine amidase family protein [Brevibacillus dissolubilis]|uniref:N-acetylmuramoyl-L-alanine amidase family protein n=1 Tax=Brevibacillus dissolubilis TaxID=1844116 RepID=UPI00159BAEBB|nr:N-acetylmuramoyl-L-alanine amidase [Brevibacillus dissolubilis]